MMEVYGTYRSNVEQIREAMNENQRQRNQIENTMSNFQRGLLGVEKEMLPIYKLTEKLRETQKNIELCVQELNIINENFNITQELSPILMSGSKFDQDAYIKALLKILACISFLETHRSYEGSSKALEQAKELLIQAQKKCKNDFLSAIGVILRGSRHEENGSLIWHKPNQESIQKVIQLLECLLDSHMDPMELVQEYAVQRLQAIKLFVSPEEQSFPFPIQKETIDSLQKRLNEIEVTLEAEKELSSMIFMKQNEELRHTAFCRTILPIFESLRQEIESSLKALKQQDVFQLLKVYALLEQRRLNKIEPLIQPPLLLQNPSTPCTDHTSSTTKPLDPWILVQIWSKTQEQLNQMTKYKLTNFLSEIIADHPGSLSMNSSTNGGGIFKDANVHPHTSHMMNFLRHLCDHIQPLKVLLASRTTTNTNTSTNSTTTNPMNVGTFIESIVLQLCDHLTTKSTQFTSSAIGTSNVSTSTFSGQDFQYLFLVNNFAYIGTAILHLTFESEPADSRELLTKQLRTLLGPKIEANKNQAIQHFIQSSYSLFENLLSEIPSEKIVFTKKKFTNTTSSNALLTLESGRLFKDRFTKFNNLMEEFTKRHKLFKVYDPNIHHLLVQEANRAILPRYTNFYTKYSKLQFSKKNMTKYLKYTPKQVEEILTQQLFTGK